MTNQAAEKIRFEVPSIEFKEHTLDNGMRLIMSKQGNIPMVAVNTTFKVGSKDEDEDKTGLAHLLEHLMFEGSPNIPRGKFDELLNHYGGESNAYTSWDSTSYFVALPSNHLKVGLWLDSDRLSGFGISEESLEIQKDVVLEEKLLYVDNSPYGSVEEESSKRLYKNSGYRWPIIGDMDHLRNLSISEVKDFYDKFYKPNNAVISIVGDLDYDSTIKSVEKYYGGIKPGADFKRRKFIEEDIINELREDIYDNIQLDGKFIFYRLPGAGTKEYYAMNILNGILSEGDSSRFYQELEYKCELVNECESNLYGMEDTSLFCLSAIALQGKDLEEIESRMDGILQDIISGNITDNEITKIKNKIETSYNSRRQHIITLADKFSHFKTFYNNCDKINSEIIEYLSVTKNDIIETAKNFLNKNQRVVLNYFPNKS